MTVEKKDVLYFLRITAVLLIITMLVAMLLAFVNGITAPVIAKSEEAKTLKAIKELFPNASDPKSETVTLTDSVDDLETLYSVSDNGEHIGFCAVVDPKGFKGEVRLMVGIVDGTVCGIRLLSHGETVGIGDKALGDGYFERFNGISSEGGEPQVGVDAVSGATYTSKAVKNGVKAALKAVAQYDAALGADQQER